MLAQFAQIEGIGVDVAKIDACEIGDSFRRFDHRRITAQEHPPPGEVLVIGERDLFGALRTASRRHGCAGKARGIADCPISRREVAQIVVEIEPIGMAGSVIKMNFASVVRRQRLAHDSDQRRETGAVADHQHGLFRSFRKIKTTAAGSGELQFIASCEPVVDPVAHHAALKALDVYFEIRIEHCRACDRIAARQPVGPAQFDELRGAI